jgi:hypothetical protein
MGRFSGISARKRYRILASSPENGTGIWHNCDEQEPKGALAMRRTAMESLLSWKNDPQRKPLIVNGARQVGKTWLLKQFGAAEFERVIYVSMDRQTPARRIFDAVLPPAEIIEALAVAYGSGPIDP